MTKHALLNGCLIQLDARTADQCNLFLGASGRILGMGYVPDLEDAEFEQIDLKKGYLYPNVGTLSKNALEEVDFVSCRQFAWSTDRTPLSTVEDLAASEARFKNNHVPVMVLPDLTVEGRYVTPLEDFYRMGYVSFYQDLSILDLEALEEAVPVISLLKATVVLDCSKIDDQKEVVADLILFLKHFPMFKALFVGLRSFDAFRQIYEATKGGLSLRISCDRDVMDVWAKTDFKRVMLAVEADVIMAVSSATGVQELLVFLSETMQFEAVQVAVLLSGAVRCLSAEEFSDFSGNDRPNLVFYDPLIGALRVCVAGKILR